MTSKDGTLSEYMFTVDTLPPRLQISSPNNGGFFEDTVTVKGISDSGAKVYIGAENQEIQEVTVGDHTAIAVCDVCSRNRDLFAIISDRSDRIRTSDYYGSQLYVPWKSAGNCNESGSWI